MIAATVGAAGMGTLPEWIMTLMVAMLIAAFCGFAIGRAYEQESPDTSCLLCGCLWFAGTGTRCMRPGCRHLRSDHR